MDGLYDEIRIIWNGIWSRRWISLVVAWIVCLAGWLVISLYPNSYESEARIYAQMQDILPEQVGIDERKRHAAIQGVRQTLASAVNIEKVIRSTDLGLSVNNERDMAALVQELREDIEVAEDKNNLFSIKAEAGNPRLAQAIVQKLIDIFVEENLNGDQEESAQTLDFLSAQIASREDGLRIAEEARIAFETKHLGVLPGYGSISQQLLSRRSELRQAESSLVLAEGSHSAITAQIASTPKTVFNPYQRVGNRRSDVGSVNVQLGRAIAELTEAEARGLTVNHPDVQGLRRRIASLRAQASRQVQPTNRNPDYINNPAYGSLVAIRAERAANVDALKTRRDSLLKEINNLTSKLTLEPSVAAEKQRLDRNYDILKKQYDKLVGDRENVRLRSQVEEETDSVKFRVVDPPTLTTVPVAPNRPLLFALVLIVGIAAGLGFAFLLSQLRANYVTATALERASGLPVIGSISLHSDGRASIVEAGRNSMFVIGSLLLVAAFLVFMAIEFVQRGLVA